MTLTKSQYVNLYVHINLSKFALTYDVEYIHNISDTEAN